jgi:hypothetical protein
VREIEGLQMKRIAILCLMILVLCGCSKAPSCSDQKTLDVVRQIYHDQLQNKLAAGGVKKTLIRRIIGVVDVGINTIVTVTYEKDTDEYSCYAVMETKIPSELMKTANTFDHDDTSMGGVEINTDSLKSNISYTSQLSRDKQDHLVTLQGHLPSINLIVKATNINEKTKIEQTRLAEIEKETARFSHR